MAEHQPDQTIEAARLFIVSCKLTLEHETNEEARQEALVSLKMLSDELLFFTLDSLSNTDEAGRHRLSQELSGSLTELLESLGSTG